MEIIKTVKEEEREFQKITELEKVGYIIDEYIGNREIFIKGSRPPVQARLVERNGPSESKLRLPANFKVPDAFSMYCLNNKQMEVECLVKERKGENEIVIHHNMAKIATKTRSDKRYAINGDNVMADNFLISKNKIDLNPFSYAVSNKVIFHEFEKSLAIEIKDLKIVDLEPQDRSLETKVIKKMKKGLLIEDALDIESYQKAGENLISAQDAWGDEVQVKLKEYRENGIISVILYPLMYTNLKDEGFPVGYFTIFSRDKKLTMSDYQALDNIHERVLDRVKDANTIFIKEKQRVTNIGLGGVALTIVDKELQELVVNRRDLSLDIVFKMQSPIRFYAEIKYIHLNAEKEMTIGLDFEGTVTTERSGSGARKILQDNVGYLLKQGFGFQIP